MIDVMQRVAQTLPDRYEIERELGKGGTAVVYLARDRKHNRDVAIKVMRPEVALAVGADRFLSEIEIVASLTHPHILPLYDSGSADGTPYFVMPYVKGESLRERLRRDHVLPIEEAIRIARQVANALAFAHESGVVHRDVKPENILIEAGHAVVADFGLARALSQVQGQNVTDPGSAVGTPEYMSPEQACGEPIDGRADIYALGCVLYEMLVGEPPITGPSALAVLARKTTEPVRSIRVVRPNVPRDVEQVVTRALAVVPADRFASAEEFVGALSLNGVPTPAPAMSIAALPFSNLSPDPGTDYFAEGITEEITNALAKIRTLRVASRSSVLFYQRSGADVQAVGRALKVATVLEGSVRRAADRLRITVQLIDVRTGYHLWSETYDRKVEDVFAIEDEIAEKVASTLRVILTDTERRNIAKVTTGKVKAYDFYLRGRQFFHQNRKQSLKFALEMFERAIAVDPDYALAHAGVADCCSLIAMYYPPAKAGLPRADQASQRALELDPDLPEAHAARGFALFQMERFEESIAEFQTAIRLDAKQFEARYFYARLRFQQGRFEEAAQLFEDACRARDDYSASYFAAQSYAALGSEVGARAAYGRALKSVERHLELNPDDPRAATMCACCHCRLGDRTKGLEWAERALAIDPSDAGVRYNVACLFALEGEPDRALDCLEQAVASGFGNREWIKRDPDVESLRNLPRFRALFANGRSNHNR